MTEGRKEGDGRKEGRKEGKGKKEGDGRKEGRKDGEGRILRKVPLILPRRSLRLHVKIMGSEGRKEVKEGR